MSVHEVGRSDDGTIYIVSDLVLGVPLSDWLSAQTPTPREAAELCRAFTIAPLEAPAAGGSE